MNYLLTCSHKFLQTGLFQKEEKMFVISKMNSIVRIEPKHFNRELPDALSDVLNAKLANKVLKDVGLVISLFDIIEIGESHVIAGDGASHTKGKYLFYKYCPSTKLLF